MSAATETRCYGTHELGAPTCDKCEAYAGDSRDRAAFAERMRLRRIRDEQGSALRAVDRLLSTMEQTAKVRACRARIAKGLEPIQ